MLSDRCLSSLFCLSVCLSVLPVTSVYCGQTVGWIKMKLDTEVGLGSGNTHCVMACLHEAIVAAIGRATDRRDDHLV